MNTTRRGGTVPGLVVGLLGVAVAAVGAGVPASAQVPASGAARTTAAAADRAPAADRPVVLVGSQLELRRAVAAANQRPGVDRIGLTRAVGLARGNGAGSGALTLDLDVTDDLVLNGAGFAINGRGLDRVLDVAEGVRLELNNLTLRGGSPAAAAEGGGLLRVSGGTARLGRVSLTGGTARDEADGDASGGALLNQGGRVVLVRSAVTDSGADRSGGGIDAEGGTTMIRDSTLEGNGSSRGGAVHVGGDGVLQVRDSNVTGNGAESGGGGLWISDAATASVQGTTISGNRVTRAVTGQGGGGILDEGGAVTVTGGSITDNEATGMAGVGGGVLTDGDLVAVDVLVARNEAGQDGGGIEVRAGSARLEGTDLVDNVAGAVPGRGGGLHVFGEGLVSISDAEVRGNTAGWQGGGLWNSGSGRMAVTDTVVADNTARAIYDDGGGGGLFQQQRDGGGGRGAPGTLDLNGVVVSGNAAAGEAGAGGGLLSAKGFVVGYDCAFTDNTAALSGGAVEAVGVEGLDGGRVTLTRTDLQGNHADLGGAVHLTGAALVGIDDTDITDNAAGQRGGGVANSTEGRLSVTGADVTGNTAPFAPDAYQEGEVAGGATINDRVVPIGDNRASYPRP